MIESRYYDFNFTTNQPKLDHPAYVHVTIPADKRGLIIHSGTDGKAIGVVVTGEKIEDRR